MEELGKRSRISVPARHISEGAAPCPYWLAPCPSIHCPALFLCFQTADVKMLVKCLQIYAHVFIDRPQNCAQTSFRSCAGLRPNFGRSRSKLCPITCRSRTKLCPNFGRSRARLCPISFAPCPFPNLAGTLRIQTAASSSLQPNWSLVTTRKSSIRSRDLYSRIFADFFRQETRSRGAAYIQVFP